MRFLSLYCGSYRDKHMSDLIGEFNYLGSLHHYGDRKGLGKWEPQVRWSFVAADEARQVIWCRIQKAGLH
jgi:hypothetical protein